MTPATYRAMRKIAADAEITDTATTTHTVNNKKPPKKKSKLTRILQATAATAALGLGAYAAYKLINYRNPLDAADAKYRDQSEKAAERTRARGDSYQRAAAATSDRVEAESLERSYKPFKPGFFENLYIKYIKPGTARFRKNTVDAETFLQ